MKVVSDIRFFRCKKYLHLFMSGYTNFTLKSHILNIKNFERVRDTIWIPIFLDGFVKVYIHFLSLVPCATGNIEDWLYGIPLN